MLTSVLGTLVCRYRRCIRVVSEIVFSCLAS